MKQLTIYKIRIDTARKLERQNISPIHFIDGFVVDGPVNDSLSVNPHKMQHFVVDNLTGKPYKSGELMEAVPANDVNKALRSTDVVRIPIHQTSDERARRHLMLEYQYRAEEESRRNRAMHSLQKAQGPVESAPQANKPFVIHMTRIPGLGYGSDE